MRTKLMAELDRDLDRLAAAYHPTPGDRRQWASIALRVGVENFHFAVEDKFKEDAAASADEQHMVVRQTTACVPAEHVFHRMPRWRIVFIWLYVGESYVCDLYAPSKVELVDGPI